MPHHEHRLLRLTRDEVADEVELQRLAELIAEVDASIAAGLISGEQGARLAMAIARAAEGLRE